MIYLTQLIYLKPGGRDDFEAFENVAIPLMARHGGQLMLRLRPGAENFIDGSLEPPDEIHLVRFEDEKGFRQFLADEERQALLPLKDASIRTSWLFRGEIV